MESSTETTNNNPVSQSKTKGYDTLEIVELASIILAIGGSVASVIINQFAIASLPISASLALNFYNRKRLVEQGDQNINGKLIQLAQYSKNKLDYLTENIEEVDNQLTKNHELLSQKLQQLQEETIIPLTLESSQNKETLAVVTQDLNDIKQLSIEELLERGQLIQDNNQNKNQINYLRDQLQEIQKFTIAELIEQSKAHQQNLQSLSVKLQEVQQTALTELSKQSQNQQQNLQKLASQLSQVNELTSHLKQDTQQLHEYTKNMDSKHHELAEVVECLKEIETKTQTIKLEDKAADSYFDLGLNHERLGDYQVAINDHTEAIKINPCFAKAYYHRAVLRQKIGDRQGALDDLRESAKHYFEQGDIPNYQKARDLMKEIHHIGGKAEERAPNVAVSGLFE